MQVNCKEACGGCGRHEGRTEGSRRTGPLNIPHVCSMRVCDHSKEWGPDGHIFIPLSPTVISRAGDMYSSKCETLKRFVYPCSFV